MNWLIWKQHRKQFLILAIIIVLYAALAIPMGLHLWHIYQHARTTCATTDTCSQLSSTLFNSSAIDQSLNPSLQNGGFNLVVLLGLILPFLLGMFMGVPLITREYNAGTNLLVWTRSISRKKWLSLKLVWALFAAALFAGGIAALTTYWSRAGNALYMSRFSGSMFDIQGIVPVGFVVFAVSIGIALGAWLKRTMAAIGIMLVLMLVMQIMVGGFVRPHYMAARIATVWTNQIGGPTPSTNQIPSGSWITGTSIVNKQGQVLRWSNPPKQCIVPASELPQAPQQAPSGGHTAPVQVLGNADTGSISSVNGGPNVSGNCLENAGYHYVVSYQPADRYWDFQRIELGLYLVLSTIPIGATYWLVLKRDA